MTSTEGVQTAPKQVLELLSGMTPEQLTETLNYMAGVVAFTVHVSGNNVTYPPVPREYDAFDLYRLREHTISFSSRVQRCIESLRKEH